MIFKTETGSQYKLDGAAMTWERISRAQQSGVVRKERGHLIKWPLIEIGKNVVLCDDSVLPGHIYHAVMTSRVTEIHGTDE
jgi:hypothetical protein